MLMRCIVTRISKPRCPHFGKHSSFSTHITPEYHTQIEDISPETVDGRSWRVRLRGKIRAIDKIETKSTSEYLPSDVLASLDSMIRVDHAGEFGADRIYNGQHDVLKNTDVGDLIQHMWDQEKFHLDTFNKLIAVYNVRPTLLMPIWYVAGYVLGSGTALLGKEAAMACTVAVETMIADHYDDQLRELLQIYEAHGKPESILKLLNIISRFRDEEMEHHDIGIEHDAEKAPQYELLNQAIQLSCKGAIFLSKRI